MRNLNEIVDNLGGIYESQPSKIKSSDIEQFEENNFFKLPKDYKDFLLEYGYCLFNECISFIPINEDAIYQHESSSGRANYWFKGSQLSCFYGIDTGLDHDTNELIYNLNTYKSRIPTGFFPIANDGLGNQICLSLNTKDYGCIYWWDHENEWDEDDFFEETRTRMPDEVKYQNIYLIAKSFTDFLLKLEVQDDEY